MPDANHFFVRYLVGAMKRAILASLSAFAIVFISGVLFGWPYSLLIGFTLAFLVWISGRKG